MQLHSAIAGDATETFPIQRYAVLKFLKETDQVVDVPRAGGSQDHTPGRVVLRIILQGTTDSLYHCDADGSARTDGSR
jgi:hypothetical protein